jgi:hypothetical protein
MFVKTCFLCFSRPYFAKVGDTLRIGVRTGYFNQVHMQRLAKPS